MAVFHYPFQQAPHASYPINQILEFREFLLGQDVPAFGGAGDVAEAEEKLPDFLQGETQPSRVLYES